MPSGGGGGGLGRLLRRLPTVPAAATLALISAELDFPRIAEQDNPGRQPFGRPRRLAEPRGWAVKISGGGPTGRHTSAGLLSVAAALRDLPLCERSEGTRAMCSPLSIDAATPGEAGRTTAIRVGIVLVEMSAPPDEPGWPCEALAQVRRDNGGSGVGMPAPAADVGRLLDFSTSDDASWRSIRHLVQRISRNRGTKGTPSAACAAAARRDEKTPPPARASWRWLHCLKLRVGTAVWLGTGWKEGRRLSFIANCLCC